MDFTYQEPHGLGFADFPRRSFDKVRYADTDRQGHVNNTAFSSFFETGRVELLYNPDSPLAAEGASFVIAWLTLGYEAEITWPGRVDVGTGVTRIGTSSVSFYQALFQDDRRVARAETIIVQVHDETRRSHPLTDETRAVLERYRLPG